jgi:hypothetical protein
VLQVANVLRAHSADGLSAVSCELETWGLLVHTAYGFLKGLAFSTYGEASILFAQNVLLLALIYKYNRMPLSRRLAAIILFGGAIAAVMSGEGQLRKQLAMRVAYHSSRRCRNDCMQRSSSSSVRRKRSSTQLRVQSCRTHRQSELL